MENLEALRAAEEYLKSQPKVKFNPYPVYDGRVMNALGTLPSDLDYLNRHDLISDKPIEEMTLADLSTMYTFLLRGERFCDGHIAGYIEDGSLLRLVSRHIELLEAQKTPWWKKLSGKK